MTIRIAESCRRLNRRVYAFEDDVAIICNDEGKMRGMPLTEASAAKTGRLWIS